MKRTFIFLSIFVFITNLNAEFRVGVAQIATSKPGKQPEDAFCISEPSQHPFICGIFDGHSISSGKKSDGGAVAKFLAQEIQPKLTEILTKKDALNAARSAFDVLNAQVCENNDWHYYGSTAIIGYIANGGENFYIANVGDSQALVVLKTGKHYFTTPHKPLAADEKKRITLTEAAVTEQNKVFAGDEKGSYSLGTSRSIGDPVFKKFGVICEPDVEYYPIKTLKYVILGTDGFWDKFRDKEGTKFLKSIVSRGLSSHKNPEEICQFLASTARFSGSDDDITVLGIFWD